MGRVPTTNWNEQKTKVPGYTQPSNQYFATRARMAYHPADKTFGGYSGENMTVESIDAQKQSKEMPPPQPESPEIKEVKEESKSEAKENKADEAKENKTDEAKTKADEAKTKADEAKAAKEEYAAKMAKLGATLPKGFIKDAKANTGH
ncbi:MAG: hypothetical protein MAG458_01435 [Nitrosopumilus sp.]|nr:hypothetical protein [Nitrosopumilus sp.]